VAIPGWRAGGPHRRPGAPGTTLAAAEP